MTICTKCKNDLHPDEFKRDIRKKNGLASWCRECDNIADSERHKVKKPRKAACIYVDWAGTPSLLGIALGIVPIQHEHKGRIVKEKQ